MEQIAQEGAIQIFKTPYTGMEEVIVGVVGTLQFDVLEYRLKNEYNVELYMEGLPYEYLRWIETDDGEPVKEEDLILGTDWWRTTRATSSCCSVPSGPSAGRRSGTRTSPSTSSAAPNSNKMKNCPPACAGGRFFAASVTARGCS